MCECKKLSDSERKHIPTCMYYEGSLSQEVDSLLGKVKTYTKDNKELTTKLKHLQKCLNLKRGK